MTRYIKGEGYNEYIKESSNNDNTTKYIKWENHYDCDNNELYIPIVENNITGEIKDKVILKDGSVYVIIFNYDYDEETADIYAKLL